MLAMSRRPSGHCTSWMVSPWQSSSSRLDYLAAWSAAPPRYLKQTVRVSCAGSLAIAGGGLMVSTDVSALPPPLQRRGVVGVLPMRSHRAPDAELLVLAAGVPVRTTFTCCGCWFGQPSRFVYLHRGASRAAHDPIECLRPEVAIRHQQSPKKTKTKALSEAKLRSG